MSGATAPHRAQHGDSRAQELSGLPNFFLAGCSKSGTSWLHRAFQEHPQIYLPKKHEIHFFDIHYSKGVEWYRQFFDDYAGEKAIGDTTTSYIWDASAPARIAEYDPAAKIIFSFRNPIERAFSHYWHEKKKGKIAFAFREVFENYDLFNIWITTGFYHRYLVHFYDYFPTENILVLIYEDMKKDSGAFVRTAYTFLEVDADFEPSILNKRLNPAWYRPPWLDVLPRPIYNLVPKLIKRLVRQLFPKQFESEYDRGMDSDVRAQLAEIFRPENEKLATLINRDLSFWT